MRGLSYLLQQHKELIGIEGAFRMTRIKWVSDADKGLDQAKGSQKLALLSFTAAPDCPGCTQLDDDVYEEEGVARFVTECFVPIKIDIKKHPESFVQFSVEWTPTVVIPDQNGRERHRRVGFLPTEDFLAQLQLGIAKVAFSTKKYENARRGFAAVGRLYPETSAAPESIYWAGVSTYRDTGKNAALTQCANELKEKYPESDWAKKASVWIKPVFP
jgi:thioredoxin-related protein